MKKAPLRGATTWYSTTLALETILIGQRVRSTNDVLSRCCAKRMARYSLLDAQGANSGGTLVQTGY